MDEILYELTTYFLNIVITVLKANGIAIGIVVLSYIIEKLTGLKLFIDHYTWVKSENNAETLSTGDTVYYLILNLVVFVHDIYQGYLELHPIVLIIWIIIVGILTQIFYSMHRKYQKIDPNKADDDYT